MIRYYSNVIPGLYFDIPDNSSYTTSLQKKYKPNILPTIPLNININVTNILNKNNYALNLQIYNTVDNYCLQQNITNETITNEVKQYILYHMTPNQNSGYTKIITEINNQIVDEKITNDYLVKLIMCMISNNSIYKILNLSNLINNFNDILYDSNLTVDWSKLSGIKCQIIKHISNKINSKLSIKFNQLSQNNTNTLNSKFTNLEDLINKNENELLKLYDHDIKIEAIQNQLESINIILHNLVDSNPDPDVSEK
jgi:hypothetical protein